MNISFDQIPRLAEQIFSVLLSEESICVDEGENDIVINLIMNVIHQDLALEARVEREAMRMLEANKGVAAQSDATEADLLNDIKKNIARNKDYVLTNGKDRAESQTNKILKAMWKLEVLDFFADDNTLRKSIFSSIQNFIAREHGVLEDVKSILAKQHANLKPYTDEWNLLFDKYLSEKKLR